MKPIHLLAVRFAQRTRLARLAALAILPLTLFGCSAAIDPVDVTLVDLKVTDVTLFETKAVFTVRLANENREAVTVDGGVYNLSINGVRIGKGLSSRTFEIPRLGFATDQIEAALSNIAMATRVRSVLDSKAFDYRIRGKVFVKSDFGTRRVRIDRAGFFDFEELGAGRDAGGQKLDLDAGLGDGPLSR